jgi:hypothetical protein
MFGQSGGPRQRIAEAVARFREKGATSPEKAMTIQELGLPPRFEEAMKRRLGATGIFVEVGGKYYLDEARLQQVEQQRGTRRMMMRGGQNETARSEMFTLRMVRMAVIVAALVLVVANILFVQNPALATLVVLLIILWIVLTVFQFYYLSRLRKREYASGFNETP